MDYADIRYHGTPYRRVIPIPAKMPPDPPSPKFVLPIQHTIHMQTPVQYCSFLPPVQPSLYVPFTYLPSGFNSPYLRPLPHSPWVRPFTMPYTTPAMPAPLGIFPVWPPDAATMPNPSPFALPPRELDLLEPGTFPAEPWGTPVPMRIHPHLLYNPYNPLAPILQWDIIHRAEQARALTGRELFVPVKLSDQATSPASPKIWIFSDHPYLAIWMEEWGPIVIEKGKITVRDVLDAIWEYFQQPLTEDEYHRISATPDGLRNLMYTARQRARDSFELCLVTRKNGFKRVDVLGGHRKFQGLRPVAYNNMTWKAFLGLLPGPVPRFT